MSEIKTRQLKLATAQTFMASWLQVTSARVQRCHLPSSSRPHSTTLPPSPPPPPIYCWRGQESTTVPAGTSPPQLQLLMSGANRPSIYWNCLVSAMGAWPARGEQAALEQAFFQIKNTKEPHICSATGEGQAVERGGAQVEWGGYSSRILVGYDNAREDQA